MTEKRFNEIISIETLKDNVTGKEYKPVLMPDEVLELLNKLNDENEQLKHKLKSLNDNFNHLKRLFDEIEEPISDELLAEYSRIVVEDFE